MGSSYEEMSALESCPSMMKSPLYSSIFSISRHLPIPDANCPVCHTDVETRDHLLVCCPLAQQVWLESPLRISIQQNTTLPSLLGDWLEHNNKENLSIAACIGWQIWKARCNAIFRSEAPTVAGICSKIGEDLGCCPSPAARATATNYEMAAAATVGWKPLEEGGFKINVDGSVREGFFGTGAVIRDHEGRFVAAATWRSDDPLSSGLSMEAEMAAMSLGIRLAKTLNITTAVLEGDALTVVRIINGERNLIHWRLRRPWEELLLAVAEFNFNFLFAPRESNQVAHILADLATTEATNPIML